MDCYYLQIEQEMTSIFGEADLKTQFHICWTTKFMPAILQYGEKSTKKNTAKQLAELEEVRC